MADNVTADPGSGGATFRTDDDGTAHWPYVKIAWGPDNTRTILTTGASSIPIQDGGNTITVDGTVTAAQATAANLNMTEASAASIKTAVEIMDDWDESDRAKVNPIAGQAGVAGGSGVVSALTQRVVLATDVGLPAGTSNIGDVDVLSIAAGDNNIGNVDIASIATGDNNIGNVDVLTIAAGDNNIGNVDLASAIPAGTNNIGDVDIASIAAGDNNIGNVDVVTLPALPAGDNNIGNVDIVTVPAPLSTTGGGTEATALRVTLASDSTGLVSVDDNGGALTVDNAGTFAVQVDGSALTALQLIDDPVLADDATFTPATSKVMMVGFEADEASTDSVDEGDAGAARMTLDRKVIVTPQPHTTGGLSIFRSLDLDESEEEVKATAGQVYSAWVTNTSTTTRWLKFYNATAANVTVGTTTPVITIGIPGNTSDDISGHFTAGGYGIIFDTAITVAATTAVADNDTGAPAANDVIVNIFYK